MEAYHSDELEPSSASLAQSDALERVIVIIIRFYIFLITIGIDFLKIGSQSNSQTKKVGSRN